LKGGMISLKKWCGRFVFIEAASNKGFMEANSKKRGRPPLLSKEKRSLLLASKDLGVTDGLWTSDSQRRH